ncbi:MAG: DeoR/GlpR family DNA-binding transcription regulator [Rhodobacteraceae bacterium]|nr:DeoR/GlpR family DNA-binding transcription regulator [Paracoccaceae bacterium]
MVGKTEKRKRLIVGLARERNLVTVDGLARHLQVSPQTIRRDLNGLCQSNILRRRHGGAELFEGKLNQPYDQRSTTNPDAKKAIGEAAAKIVPDGATVFISIGTTPEMVARALTAKKGLTVVTNNLNAAMALAQEETNRIILPGGEMRLPDRDIISDEALALFDGYRAEYGIVGVGGVETNGTLLDFHSSEVRIREKICANSRMSILVVDSTKFGRAAPAVGGHLGDVDRIIMDKPPSGEFSPLIEAVEDRLEFARGPMS